MTYVHLLNHVLESWKRKKDLAIKFAGTLWKGKDRPGHGSPDPTNPTQPARKKPGPTRPEQRDGWARAVFFDPQQSTGRARTVIFDPKPAQLEKTRPKDQKTRPNPEKTCPDASAEGARANPTRPGDRQGLGTGHPMRPAIRLWPDPNWHLPRSNLLASRSGCVCHHVYLINLTQCSAITLWPLLLA